MLCILQVPSRLYNKTTLEKVFANAITAGQNGYVYVYFSNESDEMVYFDNFSVSHELSSLREETHYYPFGLTMAGISSRAIGKPDNKRGFNGNEIQNKEFANGEGLEWYDFNARTFDQQIGRFLQVDPMTDEGGQETLSPYHFSYNNPIRFNDPDGKEAEDCCGFGNLVQAVKDVVHTTAMVAAGAANAWASNQMLGAGRTDVDQQSGLTDSDKAAAKIGQTVGDALSVVTGTAEGLVGGAIEVGSAGLDTVVAVPIVAHGASSAALGVTNLIKGAANQSNKSNPGNLPNNSQGRTSSGRKTDQHGNKLGPSGKPQVNTVKHSTQKRAKDAARNEGKVAPVKHTNPNKGKNHYHPTDKDGNKKPTSTHHEYPK